MNIDYIFSADWRNKLKLPMQKEAVKLITVEDLERLYEEGVS